MKTTKEQRDRTRAIAEKRDPEWASSLVIELLDDLESLESRCAWQAEMLERAKSIFTTQLGFDTPKHILKWITDLEKGPKK